MKKKWKIFIKNKNYAKFHVILGNSSIKMLFVIIKKCIFVIIMQLKIEHDYFRDFQRKRAAWKNENVNKKYTNQCHQQQTVEHVLLHCKKYEQKIKQLKKSAKTTLIMNYLFFIKNGLKHLIKFLKIIKIAIKKWLLGDIDDSNVETKTTTWKNLEK